MTYSVAIFGYSIADTPWCGEGYSNLMNYLNSIIDDDVNYSHRYVWIIMSRELKKYNAVVHFTYTTDKDSKDEFPHAVDGIEFEFDSEDDYLHFLLRFK